MTRTILVAKTWGWIEEEWARGGRVMAHSDTVTLNRTAGTEVAGRSDGWRLCGRGSVKGEAWDTGWNK